MFYSLVRSVFVPLVLSVLAVSGSPALSVQLSGSSTVTGVENLKVVATVTNTGNETLKLLNDPRSILSESPTNKFAITDSNSARPSFIGTYVKYSAATALKMGAFTVLTPRTSINITHDLSDAYNFTGSGPGTYEFEANNAFYHVGEDNETVILYGHQPSAYTAAIVGNLVVAPRGRTSGVLKQAAQFVGCSSSERSLINTAVSSAQTYAINAHSYLRAQTTSTTRYTTWFGTFTSARRSTVLSHFNLINVNPLSTFTYDCTCTKPAFAEVYPNKFGYIYLCSAFWNAPNTGTDSKAGTLIHESSHFTRNGGTRDYVYGVYDSKDLAIRDPNTAVMNADSHEYFAENTPPLP